MIDWWDSETSKKYNEKAQCIIWQAGNYTAKQVGINLNGINTQGENIADNGGVKEAYMAYGKWVEDHQEEQWLPGHSYSPKQLFWVSAAHVWCAKWRDEALKRQISLGYHAPNEFRIVGSFSNNDDFARDFNCPVGKKMNPKDKCIVW